MAAEDLLVHDGGDGETVKTVGEGFPQLDVVSALALKKIGKMMKRMVLELL